MNNNEIILGVVLREIHCFSIDTVDDRILLQKKVYLLNKFYNSNLQYSYNWYINGIYSPSLASDCYKLIPRGIESFSDFELTEDGEKQINKVNELANKKLNDNMTISSWYQLLSSVYYMFNEYGFTGIKNKEKLIKTIQSFKKQFAKKDIELVIMILNLKFNDVTTIASQ